MKIKENNYKGKLNRLYTDYVDNYIKESPLYEVDGFSGKLVFGYIGHEFRTTRHDKIIENLVSCESEEELIKISEWLCSKDSRHFMDSFGYELSLFTNNFKTIFHLA